VVVTATTAADGTWWLGGLAPGDYVVWADYQSLCASDPDFLARWYPDAITNDIPVALHVDAGGEATWDAALSPDDDHDGMDDVWEAAHGLDPTRDDSAEDPDGDGFTNLEEYQLGTNPMALGREEGCGCDGTGAPVSASAAPFLALLLLRRRRA
jgi:hypothetical protein